MLDFGTASGDITPDIDGVGMMGWGRHENTVHAVATPLKARAFIFRNPENEQKIAYVVAEITFITISIKQGVIEKLTKEYPDLGFSDDNVMLNATHTHSVPGGFSHYMMYNLTIPGYSDEVCQTYINGIVDSIVKASLSLKPANIYLNSGEISPELNVAFNRSIEAYNENPEITTKSSFETRHLAVDREMSLIRIDDNADKPLGMINWFAVHCTSIHSDNYLIHFDNKGYAAMDFEAFIYEKNEDFVGAFAQSSCGDVSPNFQFFPGMKFCRGQFEDDFKSAKFNGEIQANKAKELFTNAKDNLLASEIDYFHMYVDFSNVEVNPKFSEGKTGQTTGPAIIGLSMLLGTAEGPGITQKLCNALNVLTNTISFKNKLLSVINKDLKKLENEKKEIHGNKALFVETGERKILGNGDLKNLKIPDWADPLVSRLKALATNNALGNEPWTPNILPLQILIIGQLAIAAVPAEFTTIAAKRLKNTILEILAKRGITKVVLSCYSNGYSGYVTTKEEYEVQLYEGGSTHFGKWTLAAYQTKFEYICQQLLKKPEERDSLSDLKPHNFNKDLLLRRAFIKRNWKAS